MRAQPPTMLLAGIDTDYRYRFVNSAYAAFFGACPEALVGLRVAEVIGAELFARVRDSMRDALSGNHREFETELIDRTGARRYFRVAYAPEVDADGNVAGMTTAIVEDTERRFTGLALEQSEAKLREEVEISDILVRVGRALSEHLALDTLVQRVTDEATRLTGAQFGAFFYNVRRDDTYMLYALSGAPREAFERFPMPRNTAVFEPTFGGHGVVRSDDITKDARYGRNAPHYGMPEGHLPVRSYLAAPVVSRSGEVHGGLFFGHAEAGIFSERAERLVLGVAAQAAVAIDNARLFEVARSGEARFRTLADSIPQLAWMAKADGWIYWYNRRWYDYTGTTPEQMEGWGWQSVHDPQVLPRVLEAWKGSIESGEPFEMVFPLRGADGRFRQFLTRVVPVRDSQGQILHWFGTNTDIDAHKRLEDALKEASRRKDEFLAMLAHELRGPLAPMSTALELLGDARAEPAGQAQAQARAVLARQMRQLVRLVDDLLDLSRISRGKLELRRQPTDLHSVLALAVETSQPLIEARGHRLELALPPRPVPLHADPVRLAQVVSNLLTNAARYTPPGGRVGLHAQVDGRAVELVVEDTGCGIPSEALPRVFDMFVQLAEDHDLGRGGLGIGLTLVRQLVELHGGSVQAHSEGPGRGSRFVVRIPVAAADPGVAVAGEAPGRGQDERPAASAPCCVLVADDNEDAATMLAMVLRLEGHEVVVANDGDAALEAAARSAPRIAVLDIGMPGRDGYAVARALRERLGDRAPELIALTGWGQQADRRRALEAGFAHHLTKPVDPPTLLALIRALQSYPAPR